MRIRAGYRVLCADPPWRFDLRSTSDRSRFRGVTDLHYPTMSVEDICNYQLPPMADDSHLFLWRVSALQQEALDVMRAWGFTLKAEIVWRKRTVNGLDAFGMGRQVRMCHETCLIGVRGRGARTDVKNIRSVLDAPIGRHSAKPEQFYDLVEKLCYGPYVELFARRQRRGWTCLGNEMWSTWRWRLAA
jgi:N6-adenosine-specific RNA methylase IME4